jgi:predicted nucleotidyltransferase
VFGSILRDDFCAESDIDFLVLFKRDEQTNAFNQYFDLKEALEDLLKREIDLVCANAIRNPFFKQEVERSRQPLYAA